MNNQSLTPVPQGERVLSFLDFFSLWGSLGVGLLVMSGGALLLPGLSFGQALAAIVAGTVIGSALLGYVGYIGAQTGLSSAGLFQPTLGRGALWLPALLNILQLLGWGLLEIIIMRDGLTEVLAQGNFALPAPVLTLLAGIVLAALLSLAMTGFVRRFIRGIGLTLMALALVWMSVQIARTGLTTGGDALAKAGDGTLTFAGGIDIVIAFPISWLPLVADYTRYSRKSSHAFAGTTIGYALANGWCFVLGILVLALTQVPDIIPALGKLSFGALALALILIDEMDNAYSDLYSAAVCGHALFAKIGVRALGPVLAVVATLLALCVPVANFGDFNAKYASYLYLISSVFVPLASVVIVHFWRSQAPLTVTFLRWSALVAWLVGFAVYQGFTTYLPDWGATLPSLLIAGLVALLLDRTLPKQD